MICLYLGQRSKQNLVSVCQLNLKAFVTLKVLNGFVYKNNILIIDYCTTYLFLRYYTQVVTLPGSYYIWEVVNRLGIFWEATS